MTRPSRFLRAAVAVALLCAGCRPGAAGGHRPAPGADTAGGAGGAGADRVAWQWRAPAPASLGMPAADGRDVAFTYGHQHLVVLDAEGVPRWDAVLLGLRDVAPLLTADLVVAATDDGMAAFRRADGATAWNTRLQARANTPVLAGNLAVTSTWEGALVGLDLATGTLAWKVALGGSAVGPPATDGTTVVATWEEEHHQAGGAVAVDAAAGRRRWAAGLAPGGISGPVVTGGGSAVVVAGDLAAHALALTTGEERWRTSLEGAGSPEVAPVAVGDRVLTAHRLGGLDLLDAASGRRIWQVRTDGAAVRGGPAVGPRGSFALPLDDGRLLLAGPDRQSEFRQAPGRISGVVAGPGGLLVAATRGGAQNTAEATRAW